MAVDLLNTKFSDIDLAFVKGYMRIDVDEDDIEINLFLNAAKGHILSRYEKTEAELDSIPEMNIVCLAMVSDFYEKRFLHDKKLEVNPMFELITNNILGFKL